MATYDELKSILDDPDSTLTNKVEVAVVIAADDILTDASPPANQTAREAWAALAARNPRATAKEMLPILIAKNKDATQAQILAATDTAIQSNVDAAVDLFANNPVST